MIVSAKRNRGDGTPSYYQKFQYDGTETVTVAEILKELDNRAGLTDIDGNPAEPIKHECKCMNGICGTCAAVINNMPGLACKVKIDPKKIKVLTLEPLSKFQVTADLCVDKKNDELNEQITESLDRIMKAAEDAELVEQMTRDTFHCLDCGLCLQACPNFTGSVETFFGLQYAMKIGHLMDRNAGLSKDFKSTVRKEYREHFSNFCSRDFACYNVCPLKNDPLKLISHLNRKLTGSG